MPKKLFFELDEEKRARVVTAVLQEFAQYPYNESSTNRMVTNAGIGKGSLFKYFENKKDMYFYILDRVTADFTTNMEKVIADLPRDFFERIMRYAELEFTWHMHNPDKYKLFKKAFVKNDTQIYKETMERYACEGENHYYRLFDDANMEECTWEKKKVLDTVKWFLKGFNEEFMVAMQTQDDIKDMKDKYIQRLGEYMEILKKGLK